MGNRRTESKKRASAVQRAMWDCPDCMTWAYHNGVMIIYGPRSWCDKHRCTAITRAGTRCQNSATVPEAHACLIHAQSQTRAGRT
jgi:hypothetical protein